MSRLRDIWADLVDKRLWPVAAALLVALVAIPVLLLEPAAAPEAAPAPIADAGPPHLVADPAAVAAARPGGPVAGDFKNPFDQKHVPPPRSTTSPDAAAGPGTTADASGGSSAEPAASGGGGARGGGRGSETRGRARSKPARDGVKRLKIRFGRTDGKRRVRVLEPGRPLPSSNDPMLVFVEVGRGSRAEFLVSSDVVPQGDGRCEPSRGVCAQLFVRPGHTEFLDVTRASGVVQYQLDVLAVVE